MTTRHEFRNEINFYEKGGAASVEDYNRVIKYHQLRWY